MVTVEDYERYSMVLWKIRDEDEKLFASLAGVGGGDGDDDGTPPKKLTNVQKKRQARRQAQEQEQKEQEAPSGLLSAMEEAEYLDLLSRYQDRGVFTPTAGEQVEVLRLAELQLRVAAQQREFARQWPHVPGLRPELVTDGAASWSQAELAELLRGWPEGPWVPHGRGRVALLSDTPVQPGLLGHVVRKAGVLVRPEPGCVLLPLPSPPGVKSSSASPRVSTSDTVKKKGDDDEEVEAIEETGTEEEWEECLRPNGETLLHRHKADLLTDLDTLLLDWHGRPWLLPCRVTDGGHVCLGTVLPSGVHRDANRRFCNWLLEKWMQGQQEESFGLGHNHSEQGGTYGASKAPQKGDPPGSAGMPTEMGCLSGSSSPRSEGLIIDEGEGGSSPRSRGLVMDEEVEGATSVAEAEVKEDTTAQATTQGEGGAWSVDLWELTPGGKRLLLQHQAWRCDTDTVGRLCTMVTKPEYQSRIGAEQWSGLERVEQRARLALFPTLLRVRVDVPSNEVLLVEHVERQPCDEEACADRLSVLFAPVAALLEQLAGLPPGPYLLEHDAGEADAKLLVPSESGDGGLNLHAELTRRFHPTPPTVAPGEKGSKGVPPPLPLDPEVVFPDHFRRKRIPLNLQAE